MSRTSTRRSFFRSAGSLSCVHQLRIRLGVLGLLIVGCHSASTNQTNVPTSARGRPKSVNAGHVETDSARWERQQHNLPRDVTWRFDGPVRIVPGKAPIEFRFVVQNLGSTSRMVHFTGSKPTVGDVVVSDQEGRPIWSRFSPDAVFEAVATGLLINPGDSVTSSVVWDQRGNDGNFVQTGRYNVRGYLHPLASSLPRLSSDPVILSIIDMEDDRPGPAIQRDKPAGKDCAMTGPCRR